MPVEITTALISGGVTLTVAIISFLGTYQRNKKEQFKRLEAYNEKQGEQIQKFREDTRDEISKLQDSFADLRVSVDRSIDSLRASQQQFQATVELRLDNLERKQDEHNHMIERVYELEKNVAVLGEREKENH